MKNEQWMEIGVCGRYSTPFFHSIFRWDLGVLAIPFAPLELSHKAPLRRYYRQLANQTGKRDAGYPFVVEDIRSTPRHWLQVNRCPPFFVAHLNVPSLSGTPRVSQVNAEFPFDTKLVTFTYLYLTVNRCPGSLVAHCINVPKISDTMRIRL